MIAGGHGNHERRHAHPVDMVETGLFRRPVSRGHDFARLAAQVLTGRQAGRQASSVSVLSNVGLRLSESVRGTGGIRADFAGLRLSNGSGQLVSVRSSEFGAQVQDGR